MLTDFNNQAQSLTVDLILIGLHLKLLKLYKIISILIEYNKD